ncbi:polysaccharide deacetylase [Pseudonocardia saturnea]
MRLPAFVRGQIPLLVALVLAVAMLVGHQFPTGPPAAGASQPGAEPAEDPAAARLQAWMRPLAPEEKPPQFVIFSFDGAGSHDHWQRVLEQAGRSEARVTGLLSGTYLLDDSRRDDYRGPGHEPGDSSIGFGGSPQEVATLIEDLDRAVAGGHEIGTHYNGHFCQGSEPSVGTWTTAMWADELDQFFDFVDDARGRGLDLDPAAVRGGRTPCLEGDWPQAYAAMRDRGLTYDTSRSVDGIAWPTDEDGVREFWMPTVRVPAIGRKVILMDYNLWFTLNGAQDEPERAAEFRDATLEAYRAAYDAAFTQNRAPLVIGNHFNEWSGGGFSDAVEEFIPEVCLRPETVCATYSAVVEWMDLQDPAVLDRWRAMPHAQVPAT